MKGLFPWFGGKASFMKDIVHHWLPDDFKEMSVVELFLGSGVFTLTTNPKKAYLNDLNWELITSFERVRDDVKSIHNRLLYHFSNHSREYFNNVVKDFDDDFWNHSDYKNDLFSWNTFPNDNDWASRFIYLTCTTFNHRIAYGLDGKYQLSYSERKQDYHYDYENMYAISCYLNNNRVILTCADFENFASNVLMSVTGSKEKLFFFIDPPYFKASKAYTPKAFDFKEQERLANLLHHIDEAGHKFLLTNSMHNELKELYKGFNMYSYEKTNGYASNNMKKKERNKNGIYNDEELFVTNYEVKENGLWQ